ncbi:hypothetical protein [Halioxenophilus aromaticivorans]|uniref:Uncharacterized protein n=1 Tax=Halioxenophilus aromaticivorans TaxID=1306992 RepID=A0AAV3U9S1_9ALTE
MSQAPDNDSSISTGQKIVCTLCSVFAVVFYCILIRTNQSFTEVFATLDQNALPTVTKIALGLPSVLWCLVVLSAMPLAIWLAPKLKSRTNVVLIRLSVACALLALPVTLFCMVGFFAPTFTA